MSDDLETPETAAPRRRRSLLVMLLVFALVVAGGLAWVLHSADQGSNSTLPLKIPNKPGQLIKAEPFATGVPTGAHAWRITYTTTRQAGKPAIATGLVVIKDHPPSGPRPVIAWAHGTTGIAEHCAPSGKDDPITFLSIPDLDAALANGWAVVATDYTGLGSPGPHPYLIGQGEGRSVLDSVRAARQLKGLSLGDKTVVWGHSQGGGAALWAGILAPTYAPGAHVIAVAGIAPATDLPGLVSNIGTIAGGQVFAAYVIAAYAATYPDVHYNTYVRPDARLPLLQIAKHCLSDSQALVSIGSNRAFSQPFYAQDPLTGALGRRLRENVPSGLIKVPVFIAQGDADALVLPAVQAAYVAKRCAVPGNGPLDYKTFADRGHTDIVLPGSGMLPALLGWTEARFAGAPAPSTC
ncbi:MAG: hypothetical protein JWP74_2569 [Marmoricola sp.]|nr:hypothetical protein [Marmoricola sp.]